MGVLRFIRHLEGKNLAMKTAAGESLKIEAADTYDLTPDAELLARVDGSPSAWRKGRLVFVASRSRRGDTILPSWLWKVAGPAGP